jgi:multidrug resistance efflux pump
MMTRPHRAIALIVTSLFFNSLGCVPEKEKSEKPAVKTASDKDHSPLVPRPTVKVEKGRLVASVTLKGTIEGDTTTEVSLRTKSWSGPLIVEHAVGHGTQVKKDDLLLTFDTEKITQAVRAAREERELARLTVKLAELELPVLKQQLPLDMQAAQREKEQTADDLQRFLKIEKPHDIVEAQFMVKSSEFSVDSARDELAQLQKMYRDKDLTEETETVILKRYKFMLESAEHSLRGAQIHSEHTLSVDLPRREKAAQLAAARADLSWERAREQLPLHVRQKELALEKMRFDDNQALEKLEELENDLRLMTVKAPAAGVVYYGRYSHGQWSGPQATAYFKGGTLPSHDVVLTIVSTGRLFLHAEADEKESAALTVGQTARISPTRFPARRLGGRLDRVSAIPQGGKFEVLVALTDESPAGIVPGLTGAVTVVTGVNENALHVPTSAVFDDPDADAPYVYLAGDKPQKKTVKIGLVAGDKTEIVDGLTEGEEILSAKP